MCIRDSEQQRQGAHPKLAEQFGVDGIVTHAERAGVDEATEANDEATDHRPPHPVQVASQLFEQVFGSVDGLGHQPGGETAGDAHRHRAEEDHAAERSMHWDRKERLRRDQAGTGHDHA